MNPNPKDVIAVWFSCGAASAVAAKKTIELYPQCVIRVINSPVKEEDNDNRRFLRDVESWIGVNIEEAINPKFPNASAVEVWDKRKYMSGVAGAPCTGELKKEARYFWEDRNKVDWHVLGFTADEEKRYSRFILTEKPNTLPVLISSGITKNDCFDILNEAGIKLPSIYSRGYPNANCIGCVKATSPGYWNLVRQQDPDVFAERAAQSRRLGVKLARYKGERVFLDELPEGAVGRVRKTPDCGLFCEEKP